MPAPSGKADPLPLHQALHLFKRQFVLETLASCDGNRSRAAAALMIERTSLLRLIRELGITELPRGQRGRPASSRKSASS
jgi:DNA-binding NtrC family response regulator